MNSKGDAYFKKFSKFPSTLSDYPFPGPNDDSFQIFSSSPGFSIFHLVLHSSIPYEKYLKVKKKVLV